MSKLEANKKSIIISPVDGGILCYSNTLNIQELKEKHNIIEEPENDAFFGEFTFDELIIRLRSVDADYFN